MLEKGNKNIAVSIILSLALIACAIILRDAYLNKTMPQSIPYINADLSTLSNALQEDDTMLLEEAGYYLGYSTENMGDFRALVGQNKLEGLPYTRLSGRIVFSRKALDEWLYNAAKQNYESPY